MENLPPLQDIHLPASPSFWPLAIGWWILISILIFLLAWLFLKIRQRAKIKQQQKLILNKLDALERKLQTDPNNEIIGKINTLLRQLAIHYFPRHQIANLTGSDWLQFLDNSGKTTGFSKGAGRILIEAPYQPTSASKQELNFNKEEFFPLVRRWVKNISTESNTKSKGKNNG